MTGRPYDLYNSMYHRGAISPSHDVITVCLPIKAIETNQTNSNSVCVCVFAGFDVRWMRLITMEKLRLASHWWTKPIVHANWLSNDEASSLITTIPIIDFLFLFFYFSQP